MTSSILKNNSIEIANDDCFNYIKTLHDNSVDLIIIDPPYFKYLSNSWDRQWKTLTDYLNWLDAVFAECHRVLQPQGSYFIVSVQIGLLLKLKCSLNRDLIF